MRSDAVRRGTERPDGYPRDLMIRSRRPVARLQRQWRCTKTAETRHTLASLSCPVFQVGELPDDHDPVHPRLLARLFDPGQGLFGKSVVVHDHHDRLP